jgi:pilus assembly protein CpaC
VMPEKQIRTHQSDAKLGNSMPSSRTSDHTARRKWQRAPATSWLSLWLSWLKRPSTWRSATASAACVWAIGGLPLGQRSLASGPADSPPEASQSVAVPRTSPSDTASVAAPVSAAARVPVATPVPATVRAGVNERSAEPLSMIQAMVDLHSRDRHEAAQARQFLDRANLTGEQRQFAELLRHPDPTQRLALLEMLERTEDQASRRSILEFLGKSDADESVRAEAANRLSRELPRSSLDADISASRSTHSASVTETRPAIHADETSARQVDDSTGQENAISLTGFTQESRSKRPKPEPPRSAIERRYLVDQTTSDPEQSFELQEKRARYLQFNQAPVREEVTDDEVLDLQSVGPNEYRVYAKTTGSSVLSFWFENPDAPGKVDVLSYVVRVLGDPEEDERMRVLLQNLERDLNRTFPNSAVQLSYVGQQVVIRGQAKDVEEATHISRIVSQSLPDDEQAEQKFDPEQVFLGNAGAQDLVDAGGIRGLLNGQNAAGINAANINGRVINLLQIAGVHQVMLKVTVAEVNRSATRAIGVDFSIGSIGDSASFFSMLPLAQLGTIGNGATLLADRTDFDLAINALKTLNLARTLAEPTLTTLNGQLAQMQVGGSFPIPQITGATATGLQGVQFQPFGVQMRFQPTVTDRNRVRLNVQATVSTRDESTGTMVGTSNVAGLNTRNFTTTVELREGTTLAVGGLIQSNLGGTSSRTPFAGDIPVLGRAFSSDSTSYDEQELIVLVTPYLVGPVEGGPETLPLPGSDYFEPDDFEFFLQGRLEGRRAEDFRSPARTDLERIKSFRKLEQQYFIGQPGHSNAVFVPR